MREKRHSYSDSEATTYHDRDRAQKQNCISDYNIFIKRQFCRGDSKMSKKKGAKGMPSDGPGKHDPSKPQKTKSEAPVFDRAKGGIKNERPRKSRI
jgi:hypothetical protein